MRIEWSRHAFNSLSDVLDYTEDTFGPIQQVAMEEIIMHSIELLPEFPLSCPIMEEISSDIRQYRKLVVSREISVIYWTDSETIHISFVWDTRRSLHNVFCIFKQED